MFRANRAIRKIYSSLQGGMFISERIPIAKIGRITADFGDIHLVLQARIADTSG